MPQPVTFEEAIDRLRTANPGMSHGRALAQLKEWHDQGDPEVSAIPDIQGKLSNAALSGFMHGVVTQIAETLGKPTGGLGRMIAAATGPGQVHDVAESVGQRFSQPNIEAYKSQAMPGTAETVGELAGGGIGLGLESAALGPFAKMVPGLRGAGLGGSMMRGGAEMLGFRESGQLGDMSPAAAVAFGAGAPVVGALGGKVLSKVFGRAEPALEEEVGIAAGEKPKGPFSRDLPEGDPAKTAERYRQLKQGGSVFPRQPTGTMPEPEVGPAMPESWSDRYRRLKGEKVVAPPEPPPANIEPIPLGNMRTGQPFSLRTHTRNVTSRPGLHVWADPQNPVYGQGPAYPADFKKPLVIDVPNSGEEGWVHAATSLHADNPKIVERLREAQDPVGMAQELTARKAKAGGFDSVNLNTPDGPTHNLIMGIDPKWEPTKHPDITPDLTRFQKKVSPSPSKAQPELGAQIASGPKVEGDFAKVSKKIKDHMVKSTKEPQPEFHAMGDPDLAEQIKKQGVLSGNPGAYEPEVQEVIKRANKRGWWTRWLPSFYASDEPAYQRMHYKTLESRDLGNVASKAWKEEYLGLRKDFPSLFKEGNLKSFDELARAVDGLEWDHDQQKWVQTALNVDPTIDKAARRFAKIRDRGYTIVTGNDPRVQYIIERFGLTHNRPQLERLRAMQSTEGRALLEMGKRPPRPEEIFASDAMKGMLNFDHTHDLDFEPITGFLKFQPQANEKAMLLDDLKHYKQLKESGVAMTFDDEQRLADVVARHEHLEGQVLRDDMRRMPAQDFLPKRKWLSILHLKDHPEAKPFYFDTNPDHIVGSWINGITNKRVADVALAYAKPILKDPNIPGALKDRVVDWANVVRGATGFRADSRAADNINGAFHSLGIDYRATPRDIHKIASTMQDYIRFTMLELTPFRFPFINVTHMFPTTLAVAGPKYFGRAMAKVLSDPAAAYKMATEEGIIGQESEWAKEIGGIESGFLAKNPLAKLMRYPTWVTENFRKVVAHQTGLEMAKEGQFSKTIRAFVQNPKEYENTTQMHRAYARAFTKTTQFELSNIEKPIAFVGGPAKRLATQFRSWQVNLGGLYLEMLRQKDYASFTRGLVALGMIGGVRAMTPFPSLYDGVRLLLLRHGYNLPERPGYHYMLSALGMHDTAIDQIDIPTLRDPLGTDIYNPTSMLGPAIGKLIDTVSTTTKDLMGGKPYKLPSDLIHGLAGPQAVAAMQGIEEIVRGGVFSNGGVLASDRPKLAVIMRGIDMQPSVAMQRKKLEVDLENAMLSGDQKLITEIVDEATRRGFVFDRPAQRRINAFVRQHKVGEVTPWQWD